MSFCVYIYIYIYNIPLSICQSACLSTCLSLCVSLCICLSVCVYVCVHVSVCFSLSLSLYLCVLLSLSLSLCIFMFVSLFIYLSISWCLCPTSASPLSMLLTLYVWFIHRMEKNESEEAIQALRNLVLLVGSLTTCGYMELKPSTASAGSLFKIPGFTIPQPAGKGLFN